MEIPSRRWGSSILVAASALAAVSSCTADKVGGVTPQEDGGAATLLPAPVLGSVPQATPNDTVAIRGDSQGQRVVVQGGAAGTEVTSILPGGSFCTDVTLEAGEATSLTVYAMGEGLISEPTIISVSKDATAPQPASPTCSGSSPDNCESNAEICDNEVDENCDGWIDVCDAQCNDCIDDALEPNDFAFNVPVIGVGSHELQICPCRDDWFAFERTAGQSIKVTADFVHADLPINMRVYQATETGEQGDFVVGSFSSTDQEVIDRVVENNGLYYLRVYAFAGAESPFGAYTLTVE